MKSKANSDVPRDLLDQSKNIGKIKILKYDGADPKVIETLQAKVDRTEFIITLIEEIDTLFGKILRLRYVNRWTVDEIASELAIARRTYDRDRKKALNLFRELSTGEGAADGTL
ncbi:hypothetical protein WMW72_12295 [Paenibacillus filicis]|uniref:Uncharacterized protein n=1 Tax=Paenibacillus filicis TaxID=669464 RepID=A0ABU9DKC3_9BACL